MADSLLREYTRNLKKSLRQQTEAFQSETKKDLRNRLLSKALIKYREYMPRFVVQSEANDCPPPYGSKYYRYVFPEIGIVNGKRLFFEMTNEMMPSVNLHEEKKGKKTVPPTIVDCKETELLARSIFQLLGRLPAVTKERLLIVPNGFYVFEFTAQEHSWPGGSERKQTVVTVEPFEAKGLKQAIDILMRWPNGPWYKDLSKFRVCTDTGWTELKSSLRHTYTLKWSATLDDYLISPQ